MAAYDRIVAAFREIEGRHLENEFLRFLRDEHPSVRLWSATQALAFEPLQAEAVLEEIASGPRSTIRLDAEYVLRQWREGTLAFRDSQKVARTEDYEKEPALKGCCLGANALEFAPKKACEVLEEIASGPSSLEEMSAGLVLEQWRAGTLKVFPKTK